MKKETIKEIIKDFHHGALPHIRKRDIDVPFNTGKIITLSGVRRSGKTFNLYNIIQKLLSKKIEKENILYINFEDERLELKKEDLDLIMQGYRELYPDISLSECYFFFDEIQNVDKWEKFVRRVYDGVTKNIFITGSNSKLLSREIATSLRGRTITYEIFPLSFKEYLYFKDAVTFKFSKDYGKLLENVLFLEASKRWKEVFFYKNKKECDFIVFEQSQIRYVIQVSYSIADRKTRQREINGLIEACKRFHSAEGYIITFSEEEDLNEQGISIRVLPAYKFLLTS